MPDGQISPWLPEQDRHRLAVLGKLIEECNELSARAARCIIQGIGETDPDTGRSNQQELLREIADVVACIMMLDTLGIVPANLDHLDPRVEAKLSGFAEWHRLISEMEKTDG